mmetsp:Transcript_22309/g.52685  ORF Transcript_22309/g.52685 Transcript_22309/m.52685 type:complete len:349 (+) Transcript_22309:93-1139(+)
MPMRGGLGLVEHDPVGIGRVGAGSLAKKTTAAAAAAGSSVRSGAEVIRNSKCILQSETKTVTSESDHGSIRVKHNGDYLSTTTSTSTAADSRSLSSPPQLLGLKSVDMDQIEITGATSGLSSLGFNHGSEFSISPHEYEPSNRHIRNRAVSLFRSDGSWGYDTEMKKIESVTSLFQSKKPTNATSKQVPSTPGITIGVEIQSGYTEHHSTPRNASCSLGSVLGDFLGVAPPKDNKPKTSPFKQFVKNVFCSPIENSGPKDLRTNDRDSALGFSPVHNRDFSVDERKNDFYRGPSFAIENRNTAWHGFESQLDNSDTVSRMTVQNLRMQVRRDALLDSESDEDSVSNYI